MLADSEDDGDDEDALANRMLGAGYDRLIRNFGTFEVPYTND